jgi:uncharacterized protein (DUF849 family)
MCVHNARIGGNVRVGLEDSLNLGRGEQAKSNADQVAKFRRVPGSIGLRHSHTRRGCARLALKGASYVKF